MNCAACGAPVIETPGLEKRPGNAVSRWVVGITTAPRKDPTLARTVASARRAGFEPEIFAEPGSDLSGVESCLIVRRHRRYGAWHNWWEMCRQLLDEHEDAEAIVTLQDDIELTSGLREFLERDLWPSPNTGVVSLYTPKHYAVMWRVLDEQGELISKHINKAAAQKAIRKPGRKLVEIPRPVGCHKVATGSYWGACALIWPPHILRAVVEHRIAHKWQGARPLRRTRPREPHEIANVDTAIGRIMRVLKKEIRTYTPSLAQHVARYSSIGHGGNGGRRSAADFVGLDVDFGGVFAERVHPIRYYMDGTPLLTGDDEYDAAMLKWHTLGHDVSMSISQACWAEIRRHLRSGMRTLEFGSGLSTLLFANYDVEHTAIEDNGNVARDAGQAVREVGRSMDGWYDFEPDGPYDMILIDGPQGTGNRHQILGQISRLAQPGSVFAIDDTHRPQERTLAALLTEQLACDHVIEPQSGDHFKLIRVTEPKTEPSSLSDTIPGERPVV